MKMIHVSATPPAQMRLYLLGRFRLERDTQLIRFPTRKIELLLAYLVLHPGPHSREKLAAILWGDFTDTQARASLRNALAILRKQLGNDLLLAEDLAQQAREAVIPRLREYPNCPYSHLVNKARDAIFRYRQKGSSVDGLLYQRGRARQYDIISFEEPIDTEAGPLEEKASLREVLSDPAQLWRVTEERAFANVLLDNLREHLSPEGNQVLTLRMMGVPWKEGGRRNFRPGSRKDREDAAKHHGVRTGDLERCCA